MRAGEYIYEYKDLPKGGVDLAVTKTGYSVWRKTGAVEPGQRIEVALARRAIVNISAVAEEYGRASGIPDVAVSVGGKTVGRTDAKGRLTYSYDGEPGRGPIRSWLTEIGETVDERALAVRVFTHADVAARKA